MSGAAGAAAGALVYHRLKRESARERDALERIVRAARSTADTSLSREAASARRLGELEDALREVVVRVGATRATLWDVQRDARSAQARVYVGGAAPGRVLLRGDPLGWAWAEGLPLGLDEPPSWAGAAAEVWVVPLEREGTHACLLSLEFADARTDRSAETLIQATTALRTLATLHEREVAALAARERFDDVLAVLRRLPRELELAAFARELAESARRLAGATGAAVASWEQESGRVLAVAGTDGGPAAGAAFGVRESELALAAHGAGVITREERRAGALPVCAPAEQWSAPPHALIAVPLRDASDVVVGAVVAWSSRGALAREAAAVLETLAPYAALQLRHAGAFRAMREHAERDALTGLHNRRAFEARLAAETAHFARYRRPVSLLIVDVDHFKAVNDQYGHDGGDAVLRSIADAIRATVREADFAARLGGEEFVVLLPETDLAEAGDAAERLRQRIERTPVDWQGDEIAARASLGVSACPECVIDPRALLQSADRMLYASKAAGRNRVTVAAPAGVDVTSSLG